MTTTEWSDQEQAAPMNTSASPPQGSVLPLGGSLTESLWKGRDPKSKAGLSVAFLLLGGAVTVALAMTMYGMIRFQQQSLAEDNGYNANNFIRLKQESTVSRRSRKMPKKQIRQATPKTPTLAVKASSSSKMSGLKLKAVNTPNTPNFTGKFSMMGGAGMKGSVIRDGEYMPIFRTKPQYPPDARDANLEGWVDVKFTVTAQGKVINPKVVKAKPPSLFNREALACVKRWKYRAKVKDGKAVATPGVVTRVRFKLRDAD